MISIITDKLFVIMKISALRERAQHENRAAISPDVTKLLIKKGHRICLEKNIGERAGFSDQQYIDAGAHISAVPLEIISDADLILKVQPSPLEDNINELELAKEGAVMVGLLGGHHNKEYINRLIKKKLIGIAMERVPRITKAQSMDVLSSQSNLAGYRAAIEAAYHFDRALPMMMTAAGTIIPAKTLVLGCGVAGLQAIATIKRMGSIVSAYDVRKAAKEQVESLGAKFISPDISEDMEDKSGYAKEASQDNKIKQEQFLSHIIKNYDIIITTAQIPGKQAPLLVTKEMLDLIKPGAVIVDMAVGSGGNVYGSKTEEINIVNNVKIVGWSNLAARVAADSSKLYSKNLYNFLEHAIIDDKFNLQDEIVTQMLVS